MSLQGSPRLSLDGFNVRTEPRSDGTSRAPRVGLHLSKAAYPADGIDPFSPLRLPERVDVSLRDVDSSLLKDASAHFDVELATGTHRFPLAGRHHFEVEVAKGTVGYARVNLGPAPRGSGEPQGLANRLLAAAFPDTDRKLSEKLIRSLDLTFSPPLVLPNLIPTLFEAQSLFRDRTLDLLMRSVLSGPATRVASALGADRFLDSLDLLTSTASRLGVVSLRHVHAEPEFSHRSGKWVLRLAFTGHVQFSAAVPSVPFTDVVLPGLILPIPYASLDDLASDSPLASADLHVDKARLDEAIEGVRGIIQGFRGRFEAALEVPGFEFAAELVDRTKVSVRATPPSDATLSGKLRGKLDAGVLVLDAEDIVLGFPEPSLRVAVKARVEDPGVDAGKLPGRLRVHLENTVEEGSRLPSLDLEIVTTHPLATGDSKLSLGLRNMRLDGGSGGLSFAGTTVDLWPTSRKIEFSCELSTTHDVVLEEAGLRNEARIPQGQCAGSLALGDDGLWHLALEGRAGFAVKTVKAVPCVPELSIEAGALIALAEGEIRFDALAHAGFALTNTYDIAVRKAVLGVHVNHASVSLDDRRVQFPSGTTLSARVRQAEVTASGLGEITADVSWDMHDEPTVLHASEQTASLLAPDLRAGELTVHFSPEGRLWFSGDRQGLYGIRYFNTLLNPGADPAHLWEILRSEEALGHVFSALELISPDLADRMTLLRDIVLGIRTVATRSGVRELHHFIPRPALARFLSLLLAGDESLAERIAVQVKDATESRGIDVLALKNLLRPYLDEFEYDYELDGIVRWLEQLMRPMAPLPEAQAEEALPLAVEPAYAEHVAGVPSVAEMYARVQAGSVDAAFTLTLCRLAVLLTAEQLEYMLGHATEAWHRRHVQWLRYVCAVKKRIQRFASAYGGIEYALQDLVIATVLGEAVADGTDPMEAPNEAWEGGRWPPACALGPDEIASLLRAGLALDRQGRQAQINNRMLIDILERRPGRFTAEVLIEVGLDNPNALSGMLFAFLEQEQDHLRAPMDLASLLERKLGTTVPRRQDFMAGGRRASGSYYEALAQLADGLMASAGPYVARKSHLQVVRHAVAGPWRQRPKHRPLAETAKEAIKQADTTASSCDFRKKSGRDRQRAVKAYRAAFDACAALLAEDRTAFQASWLKAFWARNEEGLKALSVVRNYQEDVDEVRPWLHRRTGQTSFASEQDLLEAVVGTLIYDLRDRKKLLGDPLVRLLCDPEPGLYDFTAVSCMGVITEGEQGKELQDAFERLQERRGVQVVRAPTGTAMSLEENARRIITSIRQIRGPYGLIGYSQGCANALAAESMLRGGTPDQAALLDRLVCRNLLFSAFNGSAHGTFGSEKFVIALIQGERFLKYYQVRYSSEVVGAFMRIARAVVESPVFVRVLAGVHSLTAARAFDFHREMQIVEHAPTSTLRGVAEESDLPETLELTYYLLRHMSSGAEQDTQVLATDAIGGSTRVLNDTTRLLQRCDMTSMRQAIHHWSPLLEETRFVTTPRDKERRVYDSPKDRHVFPWVEVNARFGLIGRK